MISLARWTRNDDPVWISRQNHPSLSRIRRKIALTISASSQLFICVFHSLPCRRGCESSGNGSFVGSWRKFQHQSNSQCPYTIRNSIPKPGRKRLRLGTRRCHHRYYTKNLSILRSISKPKHTQLYHLLSTTRSFSAGRWRPRGKGPRPRYAWNVGRKWSEVASLACEWPCGEDRWGWLWMVFRRIVWGMQLERWGHVRLWLSFSVANAKWHQTRVRHLSKTTQRTEFKAEKSVGSTCH